jgi:hypothetical protein
MKIDDPKAFCQGDLLYPIRPSTFACNSRWDSANGVGFRPKDATGIE